MPFSEDTEAPHCYTVVKRAATDQQWPVAKMLWKPNAAWQGDWGTVLQHWTIDALEESATVLHGVTTLPS